MNKHSKVGRIVQLFVATRARRPAVPCRTIVVRRRWPQNASIGETLDKDCATSRILKHVSNFRIALVALETALRTLTTRKLVHYANVIGCIVLQHFSQMHRVGAAGTTVVALWATSGALGDALVTKRQRSAARRVASVGER